MDFCHVLTKLRRRTLRKLCKEQPGRRQTMIRSSAFLGLAAALAVLSVSAPAFADDVVLREFRSGTGADAVGMVPASQDTEVNGPQALFAGEDGQLYLLDQVNGRILQFDPKPDSNTRSVDGGTRVLSLPEELEPTDLVVGKDNIFVWDGDVHALKRSPAPDDAPTRGLEEVPTRGEDDAYTLSAFAQMGSQKPADDADLLDENTRSLATGKPPVVNIKQAVATKGRGPVHVTVIPDKDAASAVIEVRAPEQKTPLAKLNLKVSDRLGVVEFLDIDHQGRLFVLAENIPTTSETRASAFVVRFSPAGVMQGIFELPLSQSVALSRRFVTISAAGDVYFLRTRQASVDVIGVGFRPLKNAKTIDPNPGATAKREKGGLPAIAGVRPSTRQQVIAMAFAFESVKWTLTPAAYGQDPDTSCTGFNRIRRPGYLHGKRGQEVKGVPYCWGCMGSLTQIRGKIERMLAGNVCTRNNPRRDVVGSDCSSFVSAAWGLQTHFTTTAIPSITRVVSNPWEMQPGDAFNKPGSHVMLFLRFTPDRKAEVMEASPGACNGRVCRNVYPMAALLARGYSPVRYRALEDGTLAKAAAKSQAAGKAAAAPDGAKEAGAQTGGKAKPAHRAGSKRKDR